MSDPRRSASNASSSEPSSGLSSDVSSGVGAGSSISAGGDQEKECESSTSKIVSRYKDKYICTMYVRLIKGMKIRDYKLVHRYTRKLIETVSYFYKYSEI